MRILYCRLRMDAYKRSLVGIKCKMASQVGIYGILLFKLKYQFFTKFFELLLYWNSFWDDWMREPEQRKNRSCIHPEISRSKTFGRTGVSK